MVKGTRVARTATVFLEATAWARAASTRFVRRNHCSPSRSCKQTSLNWDHHRHIHYLRGTRMSKMCCCRCHPAVAARQFASVESHHSCLWPVRRALHLSSIMPVRARRRSEHFCNQPRQKCGSFMPRLKTRQYRTTRYCSVLHVPACSISRSCPTQ